MGKISVVGFDPGVYGGIAFITPRRDPEVFPMPYVMVKNRARTDLDELATMIDQIRMTAKMFDENLIAYIEDVHAMPRNGSIGSFLLGQGKGMIMGLVAAFDIHIEAVSPQRWKKALLGKNYPKGKQGSFAYCHLNYPTVCLKENERSRTPHDGMADALCIATYGYRCENGGIYA